MANIVLRSYAQIEGSMISKMLAETDLTSLSPGSVFLTTIQAAASSDFATEGKLLKLMKMRNIEDSTGTDLEDMAQEMGVTPKRYGAAASRGSITITDTAFNKIASNIYAGTSSPISGDTAINVVDASTFFASGKIYIGRNDSSYESINYVSIVNSGSHWKINLSGPLTKDHLVGEEVVLAQGGDRVIASGTTVSVPAGGGPGVDFKTKISYTLLDGEDIISGIDITCVTPGASGNTGIGRISLFASSPFSSAAVTNTDPTTAGRDTEVDPDLRLRIKDHVHEIGRGTKTAIYRAVINTTDPDQGNRVVSAYLREPTVSGQSGILFIDDGTGLKPTFSGIGEEVIVTSANGTEQFLQLQAWPVAKAQIASVAQEPFSLIGGEYLLIETDGVTESKSIPPSAYRSPGSVTAQEVAEAINSLFALFEARAKDGKLFITPLSNDPDYIRVGTITNNANDILLFPSARQYTIRLYKNDVLLNKSGKPGTLQSKIQSLWQPFGSTETIDISVDGISLTGISFTDLFFAANTSSSTVAAATSIDWEKVFNLKIPGIIATANDDSSVSIVSNKGNSDSASVFIIGGTLEGNMFELNAGSQGVGSQFTLNKLLGTIDLTSRLVAGDELKAGTVNTRAFLDSSSNATFNLSSATLGAAQIVVVTDAICQNIAIAQTGTVSLTAPSSGIQRVTGVSGQFANVQENDYAVLYRTPRNVSSGTILKVFSSNGTNVDFFDSNPATGSAVLTGSNVRISFFRTTGTPQMATFTDNIAVAASAVVSSFNSQISGAFAEILDSGAIRFSSNRFETTSGLYFPTILGSAVTFNIAEGGLVSNDPHTAAIESGDLAGYPSGRFTVNASDNTYPYTDLSALLTPFVGNEYYNKPVLGYIGSNEGFLRQTKGKVSSSALTLTNTTPYQNVGLGPDMRGTTTDAMQFGELDNAVFVIDNDAAKKTFNVPMYIDGTVSGPTLPSTLQFDGIDSASASLGSSSRWIGYDLSDYKFIVRSRKDLITQGANTGLRARAVNYGDNGKLISVGMIYPSVPGSAESVSWSYDAINDDILVNLTIASGAERIIGLVPNAPIFISYTGALPYTYKIQFVPGVTLATVVAGDVVSLIDQSFSSNNLGVMRINSVNNLSDGSKNYQNLIELSKGAVTGGNTLTLSQAVTQTIRAGDKVEIIGKVTSVTNSPTSSTTATVLTVGPSTVTVAPGSLFNPDGSTAFDVNSYSYVTYVAATGTFSGVTPNPVGVIVPTSNISQSSPKFGVAPGSPFSVGPASFTSNAVTYSYSAYDSTNGYFYDVSPSPVGAINFGDDIVQSVTVQTGSVVSGTYPTFTVSGLTNGTGYQIQITHGSLSIDFAPSFTIAVDDKIQILGNLYNINTVYSQTEVGIDLPYNFTGIQGGVVSRISLICTKMQPGTNETASAISSQSLRVFEIDTAANLASTMVTTVNDTAGVNSLITLSNSSGHNGSGQLLISTEDLLANGATHEVLQNASSFVASSQSSNPNITLKYPVDVSLESGEAFKLVPTTPKNVYDHLGKKQVSGLSIAANIDLTNAGRNVQVSTKVVGGSGQVQAVGGRAAGLASLAVRNTSQEVNINRAVVELDASASEMLAPGHLVKMTQSGRSKKSYTSGYPTSLDTISIDASVSEITSSKKFATLLTYSAVSGAVWAVKKISKDRVRYERMSGTCTIPAVSSGDWVQIGGSYAGVSLSVFFSTSNTGRFQIVETDNLNYFDIDNSLAYEEFVTITSAPFIFTSYHSAQVGDQLVLGALLPVDTLNKGTFTVTEVVSEYVLKYTNPTVVTLLSTALGVGSDYMYLLDQGYSTYRKVVMVMPKPEDPTNRTLVTVSPGYDMGLFTESNGARLFTPNRLGFSSQPVPGMNGYSYWTGLKRRAQYVLDGYSPDPTTFPGVRAAGTVIEVREPQIQLVSLSLKVKTKEGVALSSISDSMKNSIVGYVNSLGLGDDVVMSEIVSLVQQIPGVDAVNILIPVPGTERVAVADRALAKTNSTLVVIS